MYAIVSQQLNVITKVTQVYGFQNRIEIYLLKCKSNGHFKDLKLCKNVRLWVGCFVNNGQRQSACFFDKRPIDLTRDLHQLRICFIKYLSRRI